MEPMGRHFEGAGFTISESAGFRVFCRGVVSTLGL